MNLKQGKRHREETKQYANDGKEERHEGLKQCEDREGAVEWRGAKHWRNQIGSPNYTLLGS